jgi:Zn-dependent protease
MTKLTFSPQEKHDLLVAWLLISVAFGVVFRTDAGLGGFGLVKLIILSALTVGVGFLVHEIAHKYIAVKYGKYAEFHASIPFLVLAIFMSFFGFVFAAPGAVVISGYVTKRENGHIAVAGPLSNIVLALLALPLFVFVREGFAGAVISYFYSINVWLALFNMIPLWVLDGAKVLAWSKKWYAATLAICVALFVVQLFPW